jgi:hypothetical protein
MDFRQGTCASCSNSFRVPATFTASKAKCPKCGGVVEIGPVQAGGAGAPKSAAAKPVARAAAPAQPPPPPPRVEEDETVVDMEAPVAAARPATSARPRKESVREVASAAKDRVKSGSSSARHGGGDKGSSEGTRAGRGRRDAAPKKKSPVPMIIGGLVVLGLVVATVLHFAGGSAEPQAAPVVKEVVAKPDYSNLPDIARPDDIDQGIWDQMTQYMGEYVKPPFTTARCQPFGDRLVQQGKRAIPVILNGWKRVDITTQDGADTGWKIQNMLLSNVANGTNFGWTRDTDPKIVAANVQVIERWFKAWNDAKQDAAKWTEIAKTGTTPPAAPAEQK